MSSIDDRVETAKRKLVAALRPRIARDVRTLFPTATSIHLRWSERLISHTPCRVNGSRGTRLWDHDHDGELINVPGAEYLTIVRLREDLDYLVELDAPGRHTSLRRSTGPQYDRSEQPLILRLPVLDKP